MPHPFPASRANKDCLARLLHAGHELTLEAIAGALGVTPRTARRTLRALEAEGLPIRTRRVGRHKLHYLDEADRQSAAEAVPLTEREMLALAVAAEAARAVLEPTPLAEALATARGKLLGSAEVYTFEPEAVAEAWHFGQAAAQAIAPAVFETLRRAVAERRSVVIDYVNAQGQRSQDREIDPYVVAAVAGSWLVVARAPHHGRVVHFALPSIERAVLGAPYEPPADFEAELHFREAFGAFAGGDVEEVRLWVAPEAAASFRRKAYHPTQLIEEDRADGLVVSFEAPVNPALCAFVRSFGAVVRVLAPAALAEQVAADAAAVAALYDASVLQPA